MAASAGGIKKQPGKAKIGQGKNRKHHHLWAVPGETETSAPNSGVLRPLMSLWYKNYFLPKMELLPARISLHEMGHPPGDACLTPDSLTWIIHAGRLCPSSIGLTPGSGSMSTMLVTVKIIHIYSIHTTNLS